MFANIYIKTEVPTTKNSNIGRLDVLYSGTSRLPKQIDTKF